MLHTPDGAVLDEATDYIDVVRYLAQVAGLTIKELSELLGADGRTIRRWLKDDDSSEPSERYFQVIDDCRYLAQLLGPTLPGPQMGRWLRAKNRYLRGDRALDRLVAGDFEAVHEAAEAYAAGVPI